MRRTVNFTGRKKVPKSRVKVKLSPNSDQIMEFKAEVDLATLDLPPQGRVYLEAYYKSSVMRFDLGEVNALNTPYGGHLDDIQSDIVFFRLKVVDESLSVGRILGLAEGISPGKDDEKHSILHVSFTDLGDRIWALDLTGPMPVLEVNNQLGEGISMREIVRSDPIFRSLVLPVVMREVLTEILIVRKVREINVDEWEGQWLRLASSLPGVESLSGLDKDPPSEEAFAEWIESAVDRFCRQHGFKQQYEAAMGDAK